MGTMMLTLIAIAIALAVAVMPQVKTIFGLFLLVVAVVVLDYILIVLEHCNVKRRSNSPKK